MSTKTMSTKTMSTKTMSTETTALTRVLSTEERRDESPLSETLEAMPALAARGLLYLFLALMASFFLFAAFSPIDLIVTAPAVIAPEGKTSVIQPDLPGVITEVKVREGEIVTKDQVVALVEAKEVAPYLPALQTTKADLEDIEEESSKILPAKQKQLELQLQLLRDKEQHLTAQEKGLAQRITEEKAAFVLTEALHELENKQQDQRCARQELEADNARLAFEQLWKRELETTRKLRQQDVVSELQLLAVQRGYREAETNVAKTQSLVTDCRQEKAILKKKFEQARNLHDKTLGELWEKQRESAFTLGSTKVEILQKQQELDLMWLESGKKRRNAEMRYRNALDLAAVNLPGSSRSRLEEIAAGKNRAATVFSVRSPVNGTITAIHVRNRGESVTAGQTIMTLVPEGKLVAEIRIANRDIGMLRAGERYAVKLKFDAFPFAEHGAMPAVLERIVDAAEEKSDAEPAVFRAYAALGRDYFRVDDRQVLIRAGMTAQAEITTEKDKTLLQLLLLPLAKWRPTRTASE